MIRCKSKIPSLAEVCARTAAAVSRHRRIVHARRCYFVSDLRFSAHARVPFAGKGGFVQMGRGKKQTAKKLCVARMRVAAQAQLFLRRSQRQ
jgi:hypothetical protein